MTAYRKPLEGTASIHGDGMGRLYIVKKVSSSVKSEETNKKRQSDAMMGIF